MNGKKTSFYNRREDYVILIPPVYSLLAYTIAVTQMFAVYPPRESVISPLALAFGVGVYSTYRLLHALGYRQSFHMAQVLTLVDLVVCIPLVLITDGIHSPFLLYTITPVLTSAT